MNDNLEATIKNITDIWFEMDIKNDKLKLINRSSRLRHRSPKTLVVLIWRQ